MTSRALLCTARAHGPVYGRPARALRYMSIGEAPLLLRGVGETAPASTVASRRAACTDSPASACARGQRRATGRGTGFGSSRAGRIWTGRLAWPSFFLASLDGALTQNACSAIRRCSGESSGGASNCGRQVLRERAGVPCKMLLSRSPVVACVAIRDTHHSMCAGRETVGRCDVCFSRGKCRRSSGKHGSRCGKRRKMRPRSWATAHVSGTPKTRTHQVSIVVCVCLLGTSQWAFVYQWRSCVRGVCACVHGGVGWGLTRSEPRLPSPPFTVSPLARLHASTTTETIKRRSNVYSDIFYK
jgi:hypothetical protein